MAVGWIALIGQAWRGEVWSQPCESKGGDPEESQGEMTRQGDGN